MLKVGHVLNQESAISVVDKQVVDGLREFCRRSPILE